jgi:hypothetical protein
MKRLIAMAGLFTVLSGLFTSANAKDEYKLAKIYTDLRSMVLATKPDALGLKPANGEVWGVLMKTGYPEAIASLVALADGTVSMYFSNGGGIIGLGPHPEPHRLGKELIAFAQKYSQQTKPTKSFPLPPHTFTRFYLLTGSGVVTAEAKEDDLGNQRHVLSPLFHKAHELISAIIIVDEQRRAEQSK